MIIFWEWNFERAPLPLCSLWLLLGYWVLPMIGLLIFKITTYCCFWSVTKLCPTLCDPKDCSILGSSILHYLLEFAQIHIHWVSWCYLAISSSVTHFSFCLRSFLASGSFPMSQPFASGGQRIGASASASVFPEKCSGLISFGINWFDLLAVQGVLKHLLCCCCC